MLYHLKSETAEGGKQAVRIRRLNESVFTSAPKLEAFGVKEKVQYITFIHCMVYILGLAQILVFTSLSWRVKTAESVIKHVPLA